MASIEPDKPLVFAAVTDPKALGILDSHVNITGVRDMIDVPREIDMLKRLLPDAKKIALLFNPSEINSRQIVQQMKVEIEKSGLSWLEAGIYQETEVPAVISMAARNADAILCPTDNTVASSIQVIISQCHKAGIPLIVSDNLLVLKGALAAQGVDYSMSGQKAAPPGNRDHGWQKTDGFAIGNTRYRRDTHPFCTRSRTGNPCAFRPFRSSRHCQ